MTNIAKHKDLVDKCGTELSSAAVTFMCHVMGEENFRRLVQLQSTYELLTIRDCLTWVLQCFDDNTSSNSIQDEADDTKCMDETQDSYTAEDMKDALNADISLHRTVGREPEIYQNIHARGEPAAANAQGEDFQNDACLSSMPVSQPEMIRTHVRNEIDRVGMASVNSTEQGYIDAESALDLQNTNKQIKVGPIPQNQNHKQINLQEWEPSFHMYPCMTSYCKESFETAAELLAHQDHCLDSRRKEIELGADNPYTCEICCKAFASAANLKQHQRIHSESFRFCCEFCPKGFHQKTNLQRHVLTNHSQSKEKEFTCNLCWKGYFEKYSFQRHIRTCTARANLGC